MGKQARKPSGDTEPGGGDPGTGRAPGARRRRLAILGGVTVLLLGLVALVLVLVARDPETLAAVDAGVARDAGPAEVAEVEPNDTPAQAQALPRLPATVTGGLEPGARDLYRVAIEAPGGHLLDAWAEGVPGARLRVLGPDGAPLATVSGADRIGALGVARGSYLVALEADGGAARAAYRLHVRVEPWVKGMDWEPNDDPAHQQPMAELPARPAELARHLARGAWARTGDVDCFTVPFSVPPEGAQLRLELKPPPGLVGRLEVLDRGDPAAKIPPRTLAVATAPAAGQPALLPALGARSWESSYTACLRAAAGHDPTGRYQLEARLSTPPTPFEFEPNDTLATASALPLAVTVAGYLTADDVDWYRISAGAQAAVVVTVRAPAATEVALCDAAGRPLAVATGAAGQAVVVQRAGAVFARVRAIGAGNLAATYSIAARDAARKDAP
jgi:hypothetical protein